VGRFLGSNKRVRAIVGPIGSGKSSGCNLELLKRAASQAKGPDGYRHTRFAVVRNTYRELEDTTRKTFAQWIPEELGQWREKDFAFDLEFNDVRSEILFRALDRPQDVKKVLSLELTGCYFNELREIAQVIFQGMRGRVGRYPSMAEGGPTWHGVWGDSNPWATTSWQFKAFNEDRPDNFALFEQPDATGPKAENLGNLVSGYYADLCEGQDQEWIDEYIHAKYPHSDRGSVYGALLAALKSRGGLCEFEHPKDGVFVFPDLGISDSFAMWFMRFGANRGVDVVDHYEAHGRPLSHYVDVIRGKGYRLEKIILPHDARQRNLVTGGSVQDELERQFPGQVVIGPPHHVADRLQAARYVLEQPTTRIHARCQSITGPEDVDGVGALAAYGYEYDETTGAYRKTPRHDWASHTADGFGYMAIATRFSEYLTRPAPEKAPVALKPPEYTLESLWKTAPKRSSRI
jgi:hypothetical protein